MNWFINLSSSFKVAVISGLVTIIAFLGMMFGYFINQPGLPNGVLVGGILGSLSYLALGFAENFDAKRRLPIMTIIITVIRFILIGALLLVATLLEYQQNIKIFNVFAVLGGYIISLIVYIVILLVEKKHV